MDRSGIGELLLRPGQLREQSEKCVEISPHPVNVGRFNRSSGLELEIAPQEIGGKLVVLQLQFACSAQLEIVDDTPGRFFGLVF